MADEKRLLASLTGRICVFKERSLVLLVGLAEIVTDDRGCRLSLEVIPWPGFASIEKAGFEIGSAWDGLNISERSIDADIINWVLIIRPDLIDELKSFALECCDAYELARRVSRIAYQPSQD